MAVSPAYEELKGLQENEIPAKQKLHGFNELPSSKPKSILRIIWDVIKEPMFILLVACGTLYMILGDIGEGIMLLSSVLIIIAITFYQEKKTERALEALRDLSSPRALVIRDGATKRVAGHEVVPDDLVVLQEGDRVPADAIVIQSLNLKIDESLLTGESVAVRKTNWDGKQPFTVPMGDDLPFVYSGTLIVQGHGAARVTETGSKTQLGKIGKTLQQLKEEPTLLQKETRSIIKTFSIIGFAVCIVLIIVYGITRHDWINGILAGLSLAMALLPEEFAVVLTIFMAMGAWRISKQNVLTRKSNSIETLGAVTVLCADKTGTLTENRMTLRKIFANGKTAEVSETMQNELEENFHALVEYGILAGQVNAFDPMEKAIAKLGEIKLKGTEHLHNDWQLVKEYPLTSGLFAMSRVFQVPNDKSYVIATKGAPEAIAQLCKLSEAEWKGVQQQVNQFASEGLRLLGVARAVVTSGSLPEKQSDFKFEFIGLLGLEDPLRETVAGDLKSCYEAGIRVIMITGDYPATAQNIARKMGLKNSDEVLTGSELTILNEMQLREKIKTVNVYARIIPEQKLLLVETLKENGEIVAMTGDGVNDAPALKSAHIGIAMGQRGTDVAREAASLVLIDDNFSSVIAAIRMGRRIYDNMKKAMGYIFSVHVPIASLTVIPVFFPYLPMIILPMHIAFLQLIIGPACSLIFEGEEEEKDSMQHPPRDSKKKVFGIKRILLSTFQGLFVMAICLGVTFIALKLKRPEGEVRALTFTTLIVANLGLILINRSWSRTVIETLREKNPAVKWVIGGATAFLALVLFVPPLRNLFHFDLLHWDDLLICLGAGIVSILWFEGFKLISRRKLFKSGVN